MGVGPLNVGNVLNWLPKAVNEIPGRLAYDETQAARKTTNRGQKKETAGTVRDQTVTPWSLKATYGPPRPMTEAEKEANKRTQENVSGTITKGFIPGLNKELDEGAKKYGQTLRELSQIRRSSCRCRF